MRRLGETQAFKNLQYGREYVVLSHAEVVHARDPFEAMKAAKEEFPDLREQDFFVVPRSLVHHYDSRRWVK